MCEEKELHFPVLFFTAATGTGLFLVSELISWSHNANEGVKTYFVFIALLCITSFIIESNFEASPLPMGFSSTVYTALEYCRFAENIFDILTVPLFTGKYVTYRLNQTFILKHEQSPNSLKCNVLSISHFFSRKSEIT